MSWFNKKVSFKFLVMGAGRGGTSLLAGLLDAHSQIEMGFERHAVSVLMGQNVEPQKDNLNYRLQTFLDLCEKDAKSYKCWGNKITSEQIFGLSEVAEEKIWKKAFLDKVLKGRKLIYIVRDGRSCVRSKMNRTGQSYESALFRWKFSVALLHYLESQTAVHMIKYEDIILTPEAALKSICSYLEIPFEQNMLKGTVNKKMISDYQQTSFDISKLDLQDIPLSWTDDMKEELEDLGYI